MSSFQKFKAVLPFFVWAIILVVASIGVGSSWVNSFDMTDFAETYSNVEPAAGQNKMAQKKQSQLVAQQLEAIFP